MLIAINLGLELKRPSESTTITRMLHLYISLFICTLSVVNSDQSETALRKHHATRYFVPQPMFLDDSSQEPVVELANNRTIYSSLNKILNQLKSQLINSNNYVLSRLDDEKSATKLKYEVFLAKNQTKSLNEQPKELVRINALQSATNQANETATTTINVPIRPLPQDDQYYQPIQEAHTPAAPQPARRVNEAISSTTTSLPVYYSSRFIDVTTDTPPIKRLQATTRRSSFMQDEEEPMGDEDETESGGSSMGLAPLNELGASNQNSLFRLTTQATSKSSFRPQKIKQTRSRSPPVFMASSVGSGNSYQANGESSPPVALTNGISSSLNTNHQTLGPYKRRYGQKAMQLSNSVSASPLRAPDYLVEQSGSEMPPLDAVDLADDGGDLSSTAQLASTNDATYLNDKVSNPIERWPNLNPQSIELRKVQQPSRLNLVHQTIRGPEDRGYVSTRASSQIGNQPSGPLATLYGTRNPVTGQTSFQQMSQLQPQQQQAQQSTIQSQRDLLNQPQTIQITAVPNNGLVNGLNNQLIRINALAPNGNGLLNNAFNSVWNNGYLDPFGRQVMMVNAERRQVDWSFWIWPMIAVVTLPMILGALFVPVFLKTIVILIQILQSLGLLLPIASALGQQIAQASGVAGASASASTISTLTAGNNQLEHVPN